MKLMCQNRQILLFTFLTFFVLSFRVLDVSLMAKTTKPQILSFLFLFFFFFFFLFTKKKKKNHKAIYVNVVVLIRLLSLDLCVFAVPSVPFFCLHDQIYFVVRTTSGPNLTLWSSNLFKENLLYAFVIFQRFCLLISRNLKYWGLLCVFYVFIPTKKR